MITPGFLKYCTDEQINMGVVWTKIRKHKLTGVCNAQTENDFNTSKNLVKDLYYGLFNPCEYPDDAWPITLENRIGIKPRGVDDDWYAYQGKIEVINSNPLRAAMEVYILMSIQT